MIDTVKTMLVPFANAPVKSAKAASNPIAAPPTIVNGQIYLFRTISKTRSSLLNPGICNPEARICRAWLFASMLAVCTQKMLNTTAPITNAIVYTNACNNKEGVKAPRNMLQTTLGALNQYTTPLAGALPEKVPKIGCPHFSKRVANNCTLANRAAIKMTGMLEV